MDRHNFEQSMRALQGRVPYRPFTVVLVNGNRFEVDHPGALVMRDGVAIYVAPGGIPVIFDHEGVNQFIGDLSAQTDH
jgi:hypothetical protein